MGFVEYIKKESVIHNLDCRVKFVLLISLVASIFLIDNIVYYIILLFSVFVIAHFSKIYKPFIKRIKLFIPFSLISFLLWTIFYGNNNPNILNNTFINSHHIFVNIPLGIKMALRVFLLFSIPLLFFMVTSPSEIIYSLIKFGLPYKVAHFFGMALRMIYVMGDEYERIKQAQMARGLEVDKGNLIKRIKNNVPIIIPLTLKGISLVDDLTIAMEMKGFSLNNKKTIYYNFKFDKLDKLFLILSIGILTIGIFLKIKWI